MDFLGFGAVAKTLEPHHNLAGRNVSMILGHEDIAFSVEPP